mmetsp:Transcript_16669/g.34242  ORF Transcript_16669/g.34242 Transcript_16669/m.34242 type:complete len:289 (-) Transcript_16669:315-1181(-)
MSDVVERILDASAQELLELVRLGLLTEEEQHELVRRRRFFESRLLRRDVRREDFLKYIAYELQLQLLLRKRSVRTQLAPKKAKHVDLAMTRRIIHLYDRSVRRLRFDADLWLQYARHCARNSSSRVAGRVFARALAYCSHSENLWIVAAAWQADSVGNFTAARTLSQRGLRFNPRSVPMWTEYFRLEVVFLLRLLRRRSSLGLNSDDKNSEPEIALVAESDPSLFWKGAVPLTVVKNGLKALRDSRDTVAFLEGCWSIVENKADVPSFLRKGIEKRHRRHQAAQVDAV